LDGWGDGDISSRRDLLNNAVVVVGLDGYGLNGWFDDNWGLWNDDWGSWDDDWGSGSGDTWLAWEDSVHVVVREIVVVLRVWIDRGSSDDLWFLSSLDWLRHSDLIISLILKLWIIGPW